MLKNHTDFDFSFVIVNKNQENKSTERKPIQVNKNNHNKSDAKQKV